MLCVLPAVLVRVDEVGSTFFERCPLRALNGVGGPSGVAFLNRIDALDHLQVRRIGQPPGIGESDAAGGALDRNLAQPHLARPVVDLIPENPTLGFFRTDLNVESAAVTK